MSKLRAIGAIACLFVALATAARAEDAPAPATGDSDVIPIKRVAPDFPRSALMNGISGVVKVAGTIGPDGSVTEVHVVDARPAGMFDAAALRAVKQWKFKPRVIDGVAVAREFAQTINFNLEVGNAPPDLLVQFAATSHEAAQALYARLRALCPDRYAHADDAANAALRIKLPDLRLRDSLMVVEPEHQATGDAYHLREAERCLFTSWEQFRDPEAYQLSLELVAFEPQPELRERYAAAFSAKVAVLRGSTEGSLAEAEFKADAWLFMRTVPAYYALINAQAAQYPEATPRSPETTKALDRAKAALNRGNGREARSILVKALNKTTDHIDRALMLMALARYQAALGEPDEALESVTKALALPALPWNLKLTAEMSRAAVCGKLERRDCFDAARTAMNAELGLADKFKF